MAIHKTRTPPSIPGTAETRQTRRLLDFARLSPFHACFPTENCGNESGGFENQKMAVPCYFKFELERLAEFLLQANRKSAKFEPEFQLNTAISGFKPTYVHFLPNTSRWLSKFHKSDLNQKSGQNWPCKVRNNDLPVYVACPFTCSTTLQSPEYDIYLTRKRSSEKTAIEYLRKHTFWAWDWLRKAWVPEIFCLRCVTNWANDWIS